MTGPLGAVSGLQQKEYTRVDLQIGATNANVDDSGQLLARITSPRAAADLLRELLHVVEDCVGLFDNALAIDGHGLVCDVAEGNMVDSSVLSEVDLVSFKHLIPQLFDVGFFGKVDQKVECLLSDEVLREVEKDFG